MGLPVQLWSPGEAWPIAWPLPSNKSFYNTLLMAFYEDDMPRFPSKLILMPVGQASCISSQRSTYIYLDKKVMLEYTAKMVPNIKYSLPFVSADGIIWSICPLCWLSQTKTLDGWNIRNPGIVVRINPAVFMNKFKKFPTRLSKCAGCSIPRVFELEDLFHSEQNPRIVLTPACIVQYSAGLITEWKDVISHSTLELVELLNIGIERSKHSNVKMPSNCIGSSRG